jgi:hypothetical protein
MAGFGRREQEWALQRKAAAGEITQLYKQLRSAEIREYLAEREHANHRQQEQQSRDVLEFLTNEQNTLTGDNRKISTEDFYLWMKREAQTLHARAFQLAFDLAKKAERAWQFELADDSRTFIQSGYLAGKEGLFAGDRLNFDLKQMEIAYLEQNQREYEITKHFSLAEWFPGQLIDLRRDGKCDFFLPEALFDLDCPGHSHRRIKSIAVSVPCVTGPYTSVNCSLTLTENHVRRAPGGYPANPSEDATNFMSFSAAVTAIVTSTAQADAGVFDPNPRDERYQPFEGAGAISGWTLQLLGKPRPFDYDTIADVILTLRYTARADGSLASAEKAANAWLGANAARGFSMRHEFPSEWAAFKNIDTTTGAKASLKFSLTPSHYTYRLNEFTEPAKRLLIFFTGNPDGDVELLRGNPNQAPASIGNTQLTSGGDFGVTSFPATGDFELRFDSNAIDDLWIVVDWSPGTPPPG